MFMNEALKFTQLTIDNQTNCRYGSLNTYFVSWVCIKLCIRIYVASYY